MKFSLGGVEAKRISGVDDQMDNAGRKPHGCLESAGCCSSPASSYRSFRIFGMTDGGRYVSRCSICAPRSRELPGQLDKKASAQSEKQFASLSRCLDGAQGRSPSYRPRLCKDCCFLSAKSRDTNKNTNTQSGRTSEHHVRFAPESGYSEARATCPLSANSGHLRSLFDHL